MAAVETPDNLARDPFRGMTHERYEWLDHARGIVVLMYVISIVLSATEGDLVLGKKPLGPTYLNHGYAYFDGMTSMITAIDAGQMMFIFVMGFVGYLAFMGRMEKRGSGSAVLYAVRRVGGLWGLSIFYEIVISPAIGESKSWELGLYDGVLSRLAIGALAAYVVTYFVRNADFRMVVALIVLVVHAFVYATYHFDRYYWYDGVLNLPKFPFGTWNMAGVAIAGSACGQWLKRNLDDPAVGFRERIVPVGMAMLFAAYCMEWIQPSEHHDVTTALALLSIGLSAHMLATTYAFDRFGWGMSILRPLGRNLLLLFVVTAIFVDLYCRWVADTMLPMHPYGSLLLLGILPIGFVVGLALVLEKFNIVVRL